MEPCTAPRVSGAARLLLSDMDHPTARGAAMAAYFGTRSHISDPIQQRV